MVKIVPIMFVLFFLFASGCGAPDVAETEPAEPAEGEEVDREAEPVEEVELVMYSPTDPGHAYTLACDRLADLVYERTDGVISINVVPGGALGSTREAMESVTVGTIEMAIMSTAEQSAYIDRMKVFDLPFLFPDMETLTNVVTGDLYEELASEWEKQDVKLLALGGAGYRIVASKEKIEVPEDMEGKSIRTIQTPIMRSTFEALGASPTPMDWGETYTSIETGVIDGVETAISAIVDAHIHEVAPYFANTNHAVSAFGLVMNLDTYKSLTEDQKKIMLESAKEAAPVAMDEIMGRVDEYEQRVIDSGGEVTEVDMEIFQEKVTPVYDMLREELGDDYIDRVLGLIEEG